MHFLLVGVGIVFLVIAAVAGLFGFGAISDDAPLVGKISSAYFLLLSAAAFGWVWVNRSRQVN